MTHGMKSQMRNTGEGRLGAATGTREVWEWEVREGQWKSESMKTPLGDMLLCTLINK